MSFEKAFINQFLRIILSPWNWGKHFFHIGTGVDIHSAQKTVGKSLQPNLYYSPINKLENIFIFKIARQQRP